MKKSKLTKASKHKDRVDMISNLPDHILHLILSRIPSTEEVIRTSILSKRWRYLWTSVPSIDIDCSRGPLCLYKKVNENKFKEFVCRVLANKSIDLDRFRLSCGDRYNMSTVGQWIEAAVSRNVKLLDLTFCTEYEDIEFPHCLVTCGSLEVLKLSLFAHHLNSPKFTAFPALRVLEFNHCCLEDFLVEKFLKSCPLLETLSVVDCDPFDFNCYCISCPNLKNLRIDNREIQESEGEDWDYRDEGLCARLEICCPKLVFLELAAFMANEIIIESLDSLKKAVIHPQDKFQWRGDVLCELFAGISHVESLSLCLGLIEKSINLEDLPESLPNLKTLELITTNDAFSMNLVFRILICTLNLESLQLIIQKGPLHTFPTEDHDLEFLEMDYECIFVRLKIVKLTGISAAPHHLGFIKFLLDRSPFLETMSITPSVNMTDGKLSFSIELLRFQRASTKAQIIFLQDHL